MAGRVPARVNRRPSATRAATVALTVAALAPLAVIPGGTSAFVLGKLLAVAVAVVVASLAPASGRLPRTVVVALAAGSCLLLAAALASSAPVAALFGRWPRYEGLIALPLYLGAGWVGARLLGPESGSRVWARLHGALSATAIVMAAFALIELTGARPLGGEGLRSGSLQGNATEMGLLGLVVLAVLAPAALRGRRALVVSGAVAAGALVALSGSRAAYVGTLVVLVGLALLGQGKARRVTGRPLWLASAAGAGVVTLVLAVPASRERLFAGDTVSGRLALWSQATALLRDRPLKGAGPSGYLDASVPYVTLEWVRDVGMRTPPDSPHLWPLQAAAAGGIGLAVLACVTAVLATVLAVRAWRVAAPERRAELAGPLVAVLAYGVALLTHFTAGGTTPLVALLAGACLAVPTVTPVRVTMRSRAPVLAWRLTGAVLTLTLVAAVVAEWSVAAGFRSMSRGDVAGVDSAFTTATRLRPWDADVPSQATQALAALASAGVPGAADACVAWGEVARRRIPDSMQAGLAYAVGLRLSGDTAAARSELDRLHARSPYDSQVLLQRGVLLRTTGDAAGARADLTRALDLAPGDPVVLRQLDLLDG
ncbi:O-antigen ligase family protein [uncultured Cellulomonas sp.]|uniref:O-antigen ligase family protein n=1 Tax=uncultured Cellulomonas sp. TaxID=189682 RepID=UPI0028E29B4F|nr:O-antigen ligase family protein [uncultured Cellulomonas sp.]